jgi:HK97 family phage major capsid protein
MSDLHTKVALISAKSVTPEGEKWMRVIASAPTIDRDGEVIDTRTLHIPLKPKGWKYAKDLTQDDLIDLPFLKNHDWDIDKQLGSVRSMFINAEGELETLVGFTSLQRGVEAHTLAKEGHLGNSFSGTFDYSTGAQQDGVIYDAEMIELSMVFKGSNRDARFVAASKSVTPNKDKTMTLEEKKAEAERLKKEIEAEEVETPEQVKAREEAEAKAAKEAADAEAAEKALKEKETTVSKTVAIKQVLDVPVVTGVVTTKTTKTTKKAQRELFVKQFLAYKAGDKSTLTELNEKAYEMDTSEERDYKKKAIGFADGAAIFQTEVVSQDILEAYTNVGRLGSMVNHVDILGAETWKRLVQTAGNGFQPVGDQEAKAEDKPIWTNFSVEPKEFALIVAWYDAVARRTPIAVYSQIVKYIAKEWAKLEDKIIVSFNGATTTGGDVFPATGIVPAMIAAGRIVNIATFGAADTQAGLGRAYGLIESDEELTIIANRKTWGMMATTVDTQGRNVFTVVGQQVSAGALGTFNVVISQYVPDGNAIMGVMGDYDLVTRGGLETLFSREATVGALNLYQSDASALRANADIIGKPVLNTSFVLLDFVPQVS